MQEGLSDQRCPDRFGLVGAAVVGLDHCMQGHCTIDGRSDEGGADEGLPLVRQHELRLVCTQVQARRSGLLRLGEGRMPVGFLRAREESGHRRALARIQLAHDQHIHEAHVNPAPRQPSTLARWHDRER